MAARALHIEPTRHAERSRACGPARSICGGDLEFCPTALARRAGPITTDPVLAVPAAALVPAGAGLGLAARLGAIALAATGSVAKPVRFAHENALVAAVVLGIGPNGDRTALAIRAVARELGHTRFA
jgi:hypothetical protein